ncbi:MAG TPA: CBS domain-containing protein [Streptosporangiaceae bacterium]|nr:CBS domain-containing protein [Streptosporangiaceae bacterium]
MSTTVRDVMTTRVIAVSQDADFKHIAHVLREFRVSACPVVSDGGAVVGVVSEADLLTKSADPDLPTGLTRLRWKLAEESKATAATAEQLMTSPAVTIRPEVPVTVAARVMQDRCLKRLPVVDERNHLIGIISRADVLSVYDRADSDIGAEVQETIAGEFGLDPAEVAGTVTAGVVTLSGPAGQERTALELMARVRHIEGVVAVRDRLLRDERT